MSSPRPLPRGQRTGKDSCCYFVLNSVFILSLSLFLFLSLSYSPYTGPTNPPQTYQKVKKKLYIVLLHSIHFLHLPITELDVETHYQPSHTHYSSSDSLLVGTTKKKKSKSGKKSRKGHSSGNNNTDSLMHPLY